VDILVVKNTSGAAAFNFYGELSNTLSMWQ
jgi:hypothetical protein